MAERKKQIYPSDIPNLEELLEEDDESISNLFGKWIKQKLKTGKKRIAEVE
ncbi:MAG: hypothetical protein ACE5KE_00240 [Methanosarcinales archaeon]